MRKLLRFITWSGVLAFVAVAGGYSFMQYHMAAASSLAETKNIVIEKGMGFSQIAKSLEEEGIVSLPLVLKAYVYLNDKHASFKAGEYEFSPAITPLEVVDIIASGKVVKRSITIPEGLLTQDILARVAAAEFLTGDLPTDVKEGELMPETYLYQRGETRVQVVERMRAAMLATLEELWKNRVGGLPITTKEEALILASIVEKETGVGAERHRVAGVFVNRLRRGMKLQSDPTVAYGMYMQRGVYDRTIRRSHLDDKNPFNTYQIDGLPPTPIANPGRAAIAAVLNPDIHNELFFVATGSEGHHFSSTLEEHERYVAQYRAWERSQKGQ